MKIADRNVFIVGRDSENDDDENDEDKEDRMSAAQILAQVIDQFPETRHSANARHRLHEWGLV